jgi:hypothetical protein
MLFVGPVVQRFAGLCVKFLLRPLSNRTIEFDVRGLELRFPGSERTVEPFNQPRDLVSIQIPVVIV